VSFFEARKSSSRAAIDNAIEKLRTAVAAGKLFPQYPYPEYVVMAAAMLGRTDTAFAALDEYVDRFSTVSRDSVSGLDARYLFDPTTARYDATSASGRLQRSSV